MPTEQARGKPRTTSDIYALGVIAIQALTGVHPMQLEEDNSGELVWQDKAQCSSQLQEIICKMTRYHFKERYQSAQEILSALSSMGNESQAAPPKQAEAVQYTPTVQLSDTELAALAQRQGTVVNPSSIVGGSVVVSSNHVKNFEAEQIESSALSSPQVEPLAPANPNPESDSMPQPKKSAKTLATLGVALAVGAIATGGMYFLNQQSTKSAQKSIEEQVSSFEAMIDNEDYQGCYDQAIALDTQAADADAASTMPKDQQQEFKAKCGLARAQQEADDLNYGAALELAKTLPKGTSVDEEIQQQIDGWSTQLLADANQVYEQEGNLAQAIEMVKQIPQNSSVRPQVIDAKDSWKAESEANEAIIITAEKALSEEKWQYAKQQATKVKESSASTYWQEQAQEIISQADEGISAANPQAKPNKAIAPTEVKQPVPVKVNRPVNKPAPVVADPKPQPTVRVKQDLSEPLRDLGNGSQPSPATPNPSPQNDAPMRDL